MTRTLQIRKFTPIDRDFAIYEILQGDEVLADITPSVPGEYEIAFHPACSGKILALQSFLDAIGQAKQLLREE